MSCAGRTNGLANDASAYLFKHQTDAPNRLGRFIDQNTAIDSRLSP